MAVFFLKPALYLLLFILIGLQFFHQKYLESADRVTTQNFCWHYYSIHRKY